MNENEQPRQDAAEGQRWGPPPNPEATPAPEPVSESTSWLPRPQVETAQDTSYAPPSDPSGHTPVPEYEQHAPAVVEIRRGVFYSAVALAGFLIVTLAVATALLAMRDSGGEDDPVVARVNGEEIRRSEFDQALADGPGEDILDNLIVERLIQAEAKKRGIVVDDVRGRELLNEQKSRFDDDNEFKAALEGAGITEAQLLHQLRLSEMLRQMVAVESTVTDQEVEQEYQANKEQFGNLSADEARARVRDMLQEEKEGQAVQTLLADLRGKADIETFLPKRQQS